MIPLKSPYTTESTRQKLKKTKKTLGEMKYLVLPHHFIAVGCLCVEELVAYKEVKQLDIFIPVEIEWR